MLPQYGLSRKLIDYQANYTFPRSDIENLCFFATRFTNYLRGSVFHMFAYKKPHVFQKSYRGGGKGVPRLAKFRGVDLPWPPSPYGNVWGEYVSFPYLNPIS